MVVLKRLEDARRDGNQPYVILEIDGGESGLPAPDLTPLFGRRYAALGLLRIAAAALACRHRMLPGNPGQSGAPWPAASQGMAISFEPGDGRISRIVVRAGPHVSTAPTVQGEDSSARKEFLTVPAHLPPVRLPDVRTVSVPSSAEVMDPAPRLPPALEIRPLAQALGRFATEPVAGPVQSEWPPHPGPERRELSSPAAALCRLATAAACAYQSTLTGHLRILRESLDAILRVAAAGSERLAVPHGADLPVYPPTRGIPPEPPHDGARAGGAADLRPMPASAGETEEMIDPAANSWLGDHCPTYTRPVLPMMVIIDRLATASLKDRPGLRIVGLRQVRLSRWIVVDKPLRVRTRTEPIGDLEVRINLSIWRAAPEPRLSRFDTVVTGVVDLGMDYPPAPPSMPPPSEADRTEDPYASGAMFHGPAFQLLRELRCGPGGASGILDAGAGRLPFGVVHPALLDAATHVIAGFYLGRWPLHIARGQFLFPATMSELRFYGPPPQAGPVRVECRFVALRGRAAFPSPVAPVIGRGPGLGRDARCQRAVPERPALPAVAWRWRALRARPAAGAERRPLPFRRFGDACLD